MFKKKCYKLTRQALDVTLFFFVNTSALIGKLYSRLWGNFSIPWFDHRYDWLCGPQNWEWSERGVYGVKYINKQDKVLDLACGDGIYSGLFYSRFAKIVHGVDRNSFAIKHAKKNYSAPNVRFYKRDILNDPFPNKHYDIILLFATIEHFSEKKGTQLLEKIAKSISPSNNSILLGSTPIFDEATGHGHPEHDNEFTSVAQLKRFLSPHFKKVEIWQSKWGPDKTRQDTYFLCRNSKY